MDISGQSQIQGGFKTAFINQLKERTEPLRKAHPLVKVGYIASAFHPTFGLAYGVMGVGVLVEATATGIENRKSVKCLVSEQQGLLANEIVPYDSLPSYQSTMEGN